MIVINIFKYLLYFSSINKSILKKLKMWIWQLKYLLFKINMNICEYQLEFKILILKIEHWNSMWIFVLVITSFKSLGESQLYVNFKV
jgi:hypothetical protein